MANIQIRTGEIGKKFHRLTLIENVGKIGRHYSGKYLCDCGTIKINRLSRVETGWAKSCGCLARESARTTAFKVRPSKTHGYTVPGTPEKSIYNRYMSMMNRCYNPKVPSYMCYGGRGITVCDEWKGNPVAYVKWCLANGYKKGLDVDRRDNNGNYSPDNCRLITRQQNMNNVRHNVLHEHEGKFITCYELSIITGIKQSILQDRLNHRKWSVERAINQPIAKRTKKP